MEDIHSLIRKRGTVKGKLTRLSSFIDAFQSDDIGQLLARQMSMGDIYQQFDNIQFNIENLIEQETKEVKSEHEQYRIHFEQQYYETVAKYTNKIKSMAISDQDIKIHSPGKQTEKLSVKLPTINLPTFDGNYLSWQSFWDTFSTIVHNVEYIPKVTKFQYLKSSLKGAAADLIESLTVTEANYSIAWELLTERYNNKRIIVQSHINAIFNLPRIESSNSIAIRNLHSNINKHLRALKALGEATDKWDTLLIHIICNKLDKLTLRKWEESLTGTDVPKFDELTNFLNNVSNSLEGYEFKNKPNVEHPRNNKKYERNNNCFLNQTGNSSKTIKTCPLCSQQHNIFVCQTFLDQTPSQRYETVQKLKLCFNCLSKGHSVKDCKCSLCKVCNNKHNTLLHKKADKGEISGSKDIESTMANSPMTSLCSFYNRINNNKSTVLLSTCIIKIEDKFGNYFNCRAVVDSGSQLNFISKRLCDKLKLEKQKTSIFIKGINNSNSHTAYSVNTKIYSLNSEFSTTLELHVLPSVTSVVPTSDINCHKIIIPQYIQSNLADPTFFQSTPVDLLIGAQIFFLLLKPEKINSNENQHSIIFQNTVFGWIVSGKVSLHNTHSVYNSLFTTFQSESNIHKGHKLTQEEELCVDVFEKTVKRDQTGRFIVQLPFKNDPTCLEDNLQNSLKRFYNLEKRFCAQPLMHEQYINFMREYESLNHMQLIKPEDLNREPKYYIPHHPVFKESTTTQIRVVFDATCTPPNGYSLNSILMKGPVIQSDLFSIILKFRMHKYALTADIAKMYRQILIANSQTNFQRIVWRESSDQEVQHYQLLTLTYGTTPGSFIATKCLSQLAKEYQSSFPIASHIIETDFYIDDLMTGSDDYKELKSIQRDVSNILQNGCFTLRKWCSNSRDILNDISADIKDPHHIVDIGASEGIKTLGLIWKPILDTFEFKIQSPQRTHPISRRVILSDLAKIFDPLGFLTPLIIKGKIFIQQLWLNSLGWDDPLPYQLAIKWTNFYEQLSSVEEFQIPRRAKLSSNIQLHGFCDASEKAYAACVYIRSVVENDIKVHLLCAKSRVAPMKQRTLPELELNGAQLLTELMLKVIETIHANPTDCYYWTDSSIVLSWLGGNPRQWKTYVGNRVAFIQENSSIHKWRHVKSEHNPSDVASRGMDIKHFLNCTIWFNGPYWLALNESKWPPNRINYKIKQIPATKPVTYSLLNSLTDKQASCTFNLLNKYSSWSKLIKIMAYILRFIHNLKSKLNSRNLGFITLQEYLQAKSKIYLLLQIQHFSKEIKALKEGNQIDKRSKIYNLNPFLDDQGILRVGGRLRHSQLSRDQINPILLPYSHHVTKLIFKHFHNIYLHVGPQNLLVTVRQIYWPIKGKVMAKQTCKQCITCFKAEPKNKPTLMGNLPKERVNMARPFAVTGVDFAGPIFIRSGVRKATKTKAYICVFVCFVTRAIHLEVVSDLTTNAFMASLKRFMSRRGVCSKIFSDNATNFVGAAKELRKLFKDENSKQSISEMLVSKGIEWNFIPARSPHFGGLWEAGVKSVKYHLKRMTNNSNLNFEELYTVLTQIEAILHSRPLTPLSSSPDDLLPLTPSHFLTNDSLLLPPEPDFTKTPINRLRRWHMVQAIVQHFWKRWSSEFLLQLQQRAKWKSPNNNIQIRDIVLLDSSTLPPQHWVLARVTQVHPGSDGIVRVATIKTSSGKQFTRAVNKLYPLPTNQENKD
uniref:Putative bel15-i ag n=1 Tax=Panstrongylus megistus TaxID=65343 RepID=A0A069DYA1_9HEMI